MRSVFILCLMLITVVCYSQTKVKRFNLNSNTRLPVKGVWEFYGWRGELEQRYDFDRDSLLYHVKPHTARVKIIIGQDTIRQEVDQPALPIGGYSFLLSTIASNLSYSKEAIDNGANGRVEMQFVVNEEGKIEYPTFTKTMGLGMDEEVLRVFKDLPVRWMPAKWNGKKVKSVIVLPIRVVSH